MERGHTHLVTGGAGSARKSPPPTYRKHGRFVKKIVSWCILAAFEAALPLKKYTNQSCRVSVSGGYSRDRVDIVIEP
jgi:hypothetical protein